MACGGKSPGHCLESLGTSYSPTILLKPKMKAELENMETLGVISKVEKPIDWCPSIVMVAKFDGEVRISVHLTKLNESMQCELCINVLPSVEETLAH